jgi:hypothetical protein
MQRIAKPLATAALAALLLCGCIVGAPQGPEQVSAKPVAGGIEIEWSEVPGASGYNVYRSQDPSIEGNRINPSPVNWQAIYTDRSVSDGITYYYTIRVLDAEGEEQGSAVASATADITPPTGLGIAINGGETTTASSTVNLELSASGAERCRYSNGPSSWGSWEPYSPAKEWQLSEGGGNKTVYFQCKDSTGNIAPAVSASITLLGEPPNVTIRSPLPGSEFDDGVALVFTASSAVSGRLNCTISLDTGETYYRTVASGGENTVPLRASQGQRTAEVSCSDGFLESGSSVHFTVGGQAQGPEKPTVSIVVGDGSGYTFVYSVDVYMNATQARDCRLSNDGEEWSDWSVYLRKTKWQLAQGMGNKTVYAQCRGSDGTLSAVVSYEITVDTYPPPFITININSGARTTSSQDVRLGLYAYAAAQCRFSNDNGTWSAWENYTTSRNWTLSGGNGRKTVSFNCVKRNGESVGTASASIDFYFVPSAPPSGMAITVNVANSTTSQKTVGLSLSATLADECRLGENGLTWTAWSAYKTSASYTFNNTSPGTKTIYYQCRNGYGDAITNATVYLTANPGPGSMSILIQGGAEVTSSAHVSLQLFAQNAVDCRFSSAGISTTAWENYTSSREYNLSAGDGKKTVTYECRNPQGSASAQASIILDTKAPTQVTNLRATARADGIALSWSAAKDDGTGVRGYRIFRSNVEFGLFEQVATVTTTSFLDGSVQGGSTYAYYLKAFDGAGHDSIDSITATATAILPT